MCFFLLTITSIHNIHKVTKIRNSEALNTVAQKIQLFNAQKIEKSRNSRNKQKYLKKREGTQKKKLSDTHYESNINTVVLIPHKLG